MSDKKDHFLILKKITFNRFINGIKLYTSYQLSKVTKKAVHWGLPASIAIEPTTSCNLRCPECPSGLRSFTRPTGMLQSKMFEKLFLRVLNHHFLLYL